MADNKKKKSWQDRVKIDPNDPNELSYIRRSQGWPARAVRAAILVTKTRSRAKIYAWLKKHWERISK